LSGAAGSDVEAQGFVTPAGHKLLLINKRDHAIEVKLPDAEKAHALAVDATSGDDPAHEVKVSGGTMTLEPFAVSVVSW
jgi:hypothetical protein